MNAVCMTRTPVATHFVAAKPVRVARIVAAPVRCSANKKTEAAIAGVSVAVGTMMAHPLVAEAAVTSSLKNLLGSVVSGAFVLGAIFVAVTAVSSFDNIERK